MADNEKNALKVKDSASKRDHTPESLAIANIRSAAIIALLVLVVTIIFDLQMIARQEDFEERQSEIQRLFTEQQDEKWEEFEDRQFSLMQEAEETRHANAIRSEDIRHVRETTRNDTWIRNFQNIDISNGNFNGLDFGCIQSDRPCANFSLADLSGTSFAGADLSGSAITGSRLWRAELNNAKLKGVDFTDSELILAGLSGADFAGANLLNADLSGSRLYGANLAKTNHLETANLAETCYDETTIWPKGFVPPPPTDNILLCSERILLQGDYPDDNFFEHDTVYGHYE